MSSCPLIMTVCTAVPVLALLAPATASGPHLYTFTTPAADQWQYPFAFSGGTRPTGPVFTVNSPDFNIRDGVNILRWNTAAQIQPDLGPASYTIHACTVTLWNAPGAGWTLTGVNSFNIPNRVELFGAGYGPTYSEAAWTETSPFIGANGGPAPRDPYPIHFLTGGRAEDATDTANIAWALGAPQGYTPGSQSAPFPIVFAFNVSAATTQDYLKQSLHIGRVTWINTSTLEALDQTPGGPYPDIVLREGVGAYPGSQAPKLELLATIADPSAVVHWSLYD